MSSELEKGIIKAIPTGEHIEFTEEEKKRIEKQTEEMFKFFGVELKEEHPSK